MKASNKDENKKEPMSWKSWFVKETKSLVNVIIIVFAFRSSFFEPFRIPSGSMIPTLMIGDFILVNKLSYGLKVPFSDMFTDPVYITKADNPKRGDVVVFKFPKDTSVNYIKRVVGVPGDSVELRDKVVYINDKPVESKEIDGTEIMKDMDDKFKDANLKFFAAKIGDHNFTYQLDEDNFYMVDFEKQIIPKGHFFVMGDNRDNSYDSRFWGLVPHRYIKGKAIYVWFSLIFPFGDHPFKFRPWRIGTAIP